MSELMEQVIDMLPDRTLPEPDLVSYYVLQNQRKIYLDFDVGEKLLLVQRMILRWNIEDKDIPVEDRKPIWIYIMSYGGDLDYMWSFVDTIKISKTPIYTVNIGVAASAASLIFISGQKRFMTNNAKVIIHEGSAEFGGDAVKVMDASKSYEIELKKMKEFILANTKIPRTQLMKKRSHDWSLDSTYCEQNSVCDKVIEDINEVI